LTVKLERPEVIRPWLQDVSLPAQPSWLLRHQLMVMVLVWILRWFVDLRFYRKWCWKGYGGRSWGLHSRACAHSI